MAIELATTPAPEVAVGVGLASVFVVKTAGERDDDEAGTDHGPHTAVPTIDLSNAIGGRICVDLSMRAAGDVVRGSPASGPPPVARSSQASAQ
jgi:hypothetical protein